MYSSRIQSPIQDSAECDRLFNEHHLQDNTYFFTDFASSALMFSDIFLQEGQLVCNMVVKDLIKMFLDKTALRDELIYLKNDLYSEKIQKFLYSVCMVQPHKTKRL